MWYTGDMTKYREYVLRVSSADGHPAENLLDMVLGLSDFQPRDGAAVTATLGRASKVARAIETLCPSVDVEVESVPRQEVTAL